MAGRAIMSYRLAGGRPVEGLVAFVEDAGQVSISGFRHGRSELQRPVPNLPVPKHDRDH